MPHFDWSLNLGTVLQIITLITCVISFYYKLAGRIDRIETTQEEMKDDLAEIRKELIGSLERRVRDLEITQASILTSSRILGSRTRESV